MEQLDKSLLPNIYDFISHTYPFSLLDQLSQDAVATSIKISYYSTEDCLDNEQICSVGLFMIRAGAIEQINKDGTLRSRLGVGDSFGFTQINKTKSSDYKVIFLEDTLLYIIPKQVLEFIISKNSKISEYFDSKDWVRLSSTHQYYERQAKNFSIANDKTLADLCDHDMTLVQDNDSIQSVAQLLTQNSAYAAIILDDEKKITGIVTNSDMTYRVVAQNLDVSSPIKNIMSKNVTCIESHKTIIDALELMFSYNVKFLPLLEGDKLIGQITTSNLLQNTNLQPIYLLGNINRANSVKSLAKLASQKEEIFKTLVKENLDHSLLKLVLTKIQDSFTKRLITLFKQEHGEAPCPYAFFVAGSSARNEVQFLSDQDNAIITDDNIPDNDQEYFKKLADFVTNGLNECGYPLCDGNYMASNDKWRVSYKQWEQYYSNWIKSTDGQSILNIAVFFDVRFIEGDEFLLSKLKGEFINQASNNRRFLATLCKNCLMVSPPIGMFRQFVLTRDGQDRPSFDIKKQAINLVVELARVYAIAAHSLATDTIDRLNDACAKGVLDENSKRELLEAYNFINHVRFNHQYAALEKHESLTNLLAPETLTQFERNHLKDAFRIIAKQQEAALFRYAS